MGIPDLAAIPNLVHKEAFTDCMVDLAQAQKEANVMVWIKHPADLGRSPEETLDAHGVGSGPWFRMRG